MEVENVSSQRGDTMCCFDRVSKRTVAWPALLSLAGQGRW